MPFSKMLNKACKKTKESVNTEICLTCVTYQLIVDTVMPNSSPMSRFQDFHHMETKNKIKCNLKRCNVIFFFLWNFKYGVWLLYQYSSDVSGDSKGILMCPHSLQKVNLDYIKPLFFEVGKKAKFSAKNVIILISGTILGCERWNKIFKKFFFIRKHTIRSTSSRF